MNRSRASRPATRRRDRRYAVRLQTVDRPEQVELLRRLRGPSSWRCKPHARPHARHEAVD